MELEELIESASRNCLNTKIVDSFCQEYKISFSELSRKFAQLIVKNYLADRFTWEYCSEAMNVLWGYSIVELKDPLSGYPLEVYEAFDTGEYRRAEDSETYNPQERTKEIINKIQVRWSES